MELSQTNLYIVDNQSKSAHWPTSRLAGLKLPEEDPHNLLLVYQPVTSPAGDGLPAEEYGCEIDSWAINGTNLNSQNANSVSSCIPSDMTASSTIVISGERYPTIEEIAWAIESEIPPFEIDAVYTWVDDTDPEWQERRAKYSNKNEGVPFDSSSPERYTNRDESKYSLRSLAQNAPFFRRVFVVTDRQVPSWLDETAEGI